MKPGSILLSAVSAVVIMCASYVANAQNYANPLKEETDAARRSGPCNDPWVTLAILRATGRAAHGQGNYGECNTQLYNGGSWQDYNELVKSVRQSLNVINSAGARYEVTGSGSERLIQLYLSGSVVDRIRVRLIGADGASLIGADGASMVAAGGGNLGYSVKDSGNEKRINLGKSVLIIRR